MQNEATALIWITRLISLAVLLQSIEMLQIRSAFSDAGVWRWPTLKREFAIYPRALQKILDFALKYRNFIVLLSVRILAAIIGLGIGSGVSVLVMFLSTLLVSMRWRGTFNGGSDSMTLLVLGALSISNIFQKFPNINQACLWYVGIQCCFSYFISGVAKFRESEWRKGGALGGFFRSSHYQVPLVFKNISNSQVVVALSWLILIFELSFPLALLSPNICLVYIATALLFHICNFYIFGLNRFLFAWLAAYPALLYCSHYFRL